MKEPVAAGNVRGTGFGGVKMIERRNLFHCLLMQTELTDCSDIDREKQDLLQELEIVMELIQRCVDENSRVAQDQSEYLARFNGLVDRYEKAQAWIGELDMERTERMAKTNAIGGFLFRLRELDQPLEHFDERLWLEVIDHVTVTGMEG